MVYRPYGRNSATKLGGNARDEPANAAHRCAPGPNRVQLMCVEDRPYCECHLAVFGLYIAPALGASYAAAHSSMLCVHGACANWGVSHGQNGQHLLSSTLCCISLSLCLEDGAMMYLQHSPAYG